MQQIEPVIKRNPPMMIDPLEMEKSIFQDICDTLMMWDDSKLRDTEQFIITLQQVLKHSSGVQPSPEYGGMALLLHVIESTAMKSPQNLLDCWAFATFEFSELVNQLSPLARFMDEMRRPNFSRFLKTMLIFLQDLFPEKPVEGFNLYLLGEIQGPLLREMDVKFRKYDPEGEILNYIAKTLWPIASGALGIVECGIAEANIAEISTRLSNCRELVDDVDTTPPLREKLLKFLESAEKIAEEKVFSLKLQELAPYLGFSRAASSRKPVVMQPAPQAALGPGGAPPPPVAPTGGPPPVAPPLPIGGIMNNVAAGGVQPLLFPKLHFEAPRFFKAVNIMCTRVRQYLKVSPPKGEFQPWRLVNYMLPVASRGLWKDIKEEHLRSLDNAIRSVLNEIKGTAGLQDEEQKLMTLVYMIKDLDPTPCGDEESTVKNVSRLRWLADSIYVLYAHVHEKVATGDENLVNSLTTQLQKVGLDARKRLAVWETMLHFNMKFNLKSKSTTDVCDQLRHLVTEEKVKQLLLATLMHSRKIDGEITDESRLDACFAVAKHFALVRTMVDNLCKDYKGIMILDHVRDLLPPMLGVQKKLLDVETGLTNELRLVSSELECDEHIQLRNFTESLVRGGDVLDTDVAEFVVPGSEEVFRIAKGKIPQNSLLFSLVDDDSGLPVCKDENGRIVIEEVCPTAMQHITNFLNNNTSPSCLTTAQWNDLKIATNYLGVDSLMKLLLNHDLIYFDKLQMFQQEAQRNISSISPIGEDTKDTLNVLTVLFKRITLIYDHIDTRSITNMFS
eukprot:TRINITY_DN24314_c0_g1_i1.p1 TRINITY_DN24314_c0_g1~~TRINITY_DN24314_c0_g1_i1.p1  ORF type:complete len:910 (+),score=167.47 TRINITY_DN24314_c0_g1_i1:368-2731(+)